MPRKNNRNAQGGGSIRKRADGTWEARYTVGRDPGTGKQIQRSVYAKTQADVRKKLQQATAAIDDGVYIEPSKLTVSVWLDTWIAEYNGDIKPLTLKAYKSQIANNIKPYLGAVKLSALAAPQIQKLYNSLQKGVDGRDPLTPKTIKNTHGILHKALNQAVEIGYLKFNPSDACKLPRVVKKEINPFTEAESASFIQAIKGHKYEIPFLVDLFTGMRESELLGLMWNCVDFERGTITINKQLQRGNAKGVGYSLAPLKNNKTRIITPAPYVMQLLQTQRRIQLAARLAAGSAWCDGGFPGLVFTNEVGGHLTQITLFRQYKAVVAAIGRPDARVHDMRHSYAVAAIQSGDDIKTVQENLGHHTAAFTLDVYGHVSERMKRESANRMEAYINTLKSL